MAYDITKATKLGQLKALAQRVETEIKVKTIKVNGTALTPDASKAVDVLFAVEKKATPNTGYAASYTLKANGVAISPDIDIPKDWLLNGVTKGTVTDADKAAGGKFENDTDFAVGDKYIDFSFNVKAGDAETTTHIYLNVQEFVDLYTAGDGLQESDGEFSIKLDTTGVDGLTVGTGGLKLTAATPDTYTDGAKTADGITGAMSSADKYKLDHVSAGANKVTVTNEKAGTIEIDDVEKTIVEFATDTEVAEMLNEVFGAAS